MQVVENISLSVAKLPCDLSDRLAEAYFPGRLTTEECDNQTCYCHARQMGADRSQFPKLGFAQRQILLVIFELHFDFPSLFIAFVNPDRIIESLVAHEQVVNDFSVFQFTAAYYKDHTAIYMMPGRHPLIPMPRFEPFPSAVFHFRDNLIRSQQFAFEFEFMGIRGFADNAKARGFGGFQNLLPAECAVKGNFRFSEAVPASFAIFFKEMDLITRNVVFRPVIGVFGRQPQNKGKGDHRVAGNRQHEDIVAAHEIPVFGMIEQLMYEFHTLTEFFSFCVVNNEHWPAAAFRCPVRSVKLTEKIEENRQSKQAEQFFECFRIFHQDIIKLPKFPAAILTEIVKSILFKKGKQNKNPQPPVQMRGLMVGKTCFDDQYPQTSAGQACENAGTFCFFIFTAHCSSPFLPKFYRVGCMYTLILYIPYRKLKKKQNFNRPGDGIKFTHIQ